MKLAKRENVTVLLDGQGADEVITGYSHYFDIYFNELYKNYPDRFQEELVAYVKNINPQYQFELNAPASKNIKSKTKELVYPIYSKLVKPFMPVRKNHDGLLDPDYGYQAFKNGGHQYYNYDSGLNNGLYHDAKMGKMEVLLRYGDKNSMAHSREVRLPFLNHELAEFIFSLPPWFKIHQGWSKFILRESLKDILPEKIAWRKDKIGYQTPQERWLVKDKFQDLIKDSVEILENANILNRKKKESIAGKEWQILNTAGIIKTFKL
jgi:asparagine synthase (glutamine-hydrolysing)